MENKNNYLGGAMWMGALLILGCGDSGGGPKVDSQLLGVYRVDSYQATPATQGDPDICGKLADATPPGDYIVLYPFLANDDLENPRIGGVFCSGVDNCREGAALAPEPTFGYSFSAGNDQSGWLGWGIENSGLDNDQCKVDVQAHTLMSTTAGIDIQTRTLQTIYPPRPEDVDGNNITCRIKDAIDNLRDNLPCVGAFSLEATFEASL